MNARWGWVLLVVLLSACGSTSKLRTESGEARRTIADYSAVYVADFASTAPAESKNPDAEAKHAAAVEAAQRGFADRIAAKLVETGSFDVVSRVPVDGPVLRIGGTITRLDEGNVAARAVTGFIGQAHFEATVRFEDATSGELLGTVSVDRNSWPLPVGASTNLVQNVSFFMDGAASKIAEELHRARGR
jgi:hypothetical protein